LYSTIVVTKTNPAIRRRRAAIPIVISFHLQQDKKIELESRHIPKILINQDDRMFAAVLFFYFKPIMII
jgi:hypothetical protein